MKITQILLFLGVALCSAFAEQSPPYPPSGWRPEGPAFELPNLQTNLQFNQRQEISQQGYGATSVFQNPSAVYGAAKILGSESTFERNAQQPINQQIPQQQINQSKQGFRQLTPKIQVKQQFRSIDDQNQEVRNGLTYQQYIEQGIRSETNSRIQNFNSPQSGYDYLPSAESFPTPRENNPSNIDVRRGSQQDNESNKEPTSFDGEFSNKPNFKTEQLPDFPAYNPNITHVEDKGNQNRNLPHLTRNNVASGRVNTKNIPNNYNNYNSEYKTIVLNNDNNSNTSGSENNSKEGEFGKRILTRKVKIVRRNRKRGRDENQENVS